MKLLPYTEFCERVLRVVFYPAQWVALAVLFDGIEPGRLQGERRDLARRLFGDVETVPPEARRVAVLVKGARVGGTRFGALRLVHLAATLDVPPTAPGERLYALVVGPDMRLARQGLAYALGATASHPDLARRVRNETQDSFEFLRDDGRTVVFAAMPATAGGSAVRGRSLVGALMTEAAFFRDSFSVVNDVDVYKALVARIVKGGQLVIESTTWAELGLLWQLWDQNFGKPAGALVAHCPTLLMRPDLASLVATERARDPDAAAQEFDAEFRAAGASVFLDPRAVDEMVDEEMAHPMPYDESAPKAAGGDLGFVSDSSALTIVQRKGEAPAWLAFVDEMKPVPGFPLQPSEVCRRFALAMRRYGARELICDGHYAESVKEHLEPYRMRTFPAPSGAQGKLEVHIAAREMIYEKQIKIPKLPRLVAQLKSLVSKPVAGGGMKIEFPRRRTGGLAHGDIGSSFILSLWAFKATHVSPATKARWARAEERMHALGELLVGVASERVAEVSARALGYSAEELRESIFARLARVRPVDASGRQLSGMTEQEAAAWEAFRGAGREERLSDR